MRGFYKAVIERNKLDIGVMIKRQLLRLDVTEPNDYKAIYQLLFNNKYKEFWNNTFRYRPKVTLSIPNRNTVAKNFSDKNNKLRSDYCRELIDNLSNYIQNHFIKDFYGKKMSKFILEILHDLILNTFDSLLTNILELNSNERLSLNVTSDWNKDEMMSLLKVLKTDKLDCQH